MNPSIRRIVIFVAAFVVLATLVVIVGQTAQVVNLASGIHPTFGLVVLVALLLAYAALLLTPIVLFYRLPGPLSPPQKDSGPEFREYIDRLKTRLANNPSTRDLTLSSTADVEEALAHLGKQADALTQASANVIFLSTAISQSGRLDAFVVLAELTRLVWRIAHLYNQRPTLRDLLQIYGNVTGTAFVAGSIDDIDISEQIAPILASVTGGVTAAVPGLQVATGVLVNSVLTGAANAFLTLRVGIITRRYCGSLSLPTKREVRRAASLEAAALLGGIVKDGAKKITGSAFRASTKKATDMVSGTAGWAAETADSVLARVGLRKKVKAAVEAPDTGGDIGSGDA